MEIGDWKTTEKLNELYREIRELDIESNIAELDNFGFTIVPPEKVGPPELIDRLQDALLNLIERRTGTRPDLETGSTSSPDKNVRPMDEYYWLLFEDPVFEEALMNPVALALVSYLLGDSAELSLSSALVKGPGENPLYLHCDNGSIPTPFPPYEQICNTTWLLSDYNKDNGALCFIPGSNRWQRHPVLGERMKFENAVPVEAPRGSLVVWGGNQWHGAFPRKNPGLRLAMINAFVRPHLRASMPFQERTPQEAIDRNGPRFATLMGQHNFLGFEVDGPDPEKTKLMPQGLYA